MGRIVYGKLFALMESKGVKKYDLRRDKVIGVASLEKLRKNEGNIDTRTILRLCEFLQCQPGDIMEWIPDPDSEEQTPEATAE